MKTISKFLTVTVLLISALQIHAQRDFLKADLILKSGEHIETYVAFPIINDFNDKITHATGPDAEEQTILSNDVDYMVVTSNGKKKLIKRVTTYKKGGAALRKFPAWVTMTHSCANMNVYRVLVGYDIDEDGNFLDIYQDGIGLLAIDRPGEKNATEVGFIYHKKTRDATPGWNEKVRVKYLSTYFAKDKKVMAYLNKHKGFSIEEFYEFVNEFCSTDEDGNLTQSN